MTPISLDDRIRELCGKGVATEDPEPLHLPLKDLGNALNKQHTLANHLIAERTRMCNPKIG